MRDSFRDSYVYPASQARKVYAYILAGRHREGRRVYHQLGDASWVSRSQNEIAETREPTDRTLEVSR